MSALSPAAILCRVYTLLTPISLVPMFSPNDHDFMQQALALAEKGLYNTTPNPRVGAVLVKNDAVIGTGFTQPPGHAHAEIMALNDCRSGGHDARGATIYVTLEPCSHFGKTPPCANALVDAGIGRVIAAMEDPNPRVSGQGFELLRQAGIEVRVGLLESEARALNLGFVSRMLRNRPWVRLKAAASLDGRTALPNGSSQWITGQEARRDGHAFRARACAVLTGIGTVRSDDPILNVRDVSTPRQPPRMVLDSRLEISLESRLVKSSASGSRVTIFTTHHDAVKSAELGARGCEVVELPGIAGKVDLEALMHELGERHINELHVEAGARLNASLLSAGLVDELLIYLAPALLGSGEGIATLPELERLDQALRFRFTDAERVGEDLRVLCRLGDLAWTKEE
jgi:diaminohydroxyphosphoribosylaminopyrimidine deaminase/5-amino-6-(5-phosphoribosylamino)uracil reductase